jgi:hypothetical protein
MSSQVQPMPHIEAGRLPAPDIDLRTVYYVVEPDELDALIKRREGRWIYTLYGWVRVPQRHDHNVYPLPPGQPRIPTRAVR